VDLVGPEYGGTTIPADTYVTNDIVVTSDTDWLSAQLILEPDYEGDIFQHPSGVTSCPPSPVYLEYFPAMAYDTYVSDGSGGSAGSAPPVDLYEGECDVVFDDDLLQIAWCTTSHDDTGELSLARITLANDATGTWVFVVTADPAEGPKILAEGTIEDGVLVPDEEE
jgi:hypothetical protein